MPVYNAEKTIEETLKSLARQTAADAVSCIIINDCSSDGTAEVLQELESKYPFIRVMSNEKNLGPGASRNLGITETQTEYLSFLDADDHLSPDWVQVMLDAAGDHDLIVSGYKEVTASGEVVKEQNVAAYRLRTYTGSCWARLYRTDFIKNENIRFATQYNTGEDMMFVMGASSKAQKPKVLTYMGYNYVVADDSLSKQNTRKGIQDKIEDLLCVIPDVKTAIRPDDMYGRGVLFDVMAYDIIMYGMRTPTTEQLKDGITRIFIALNEAFPGWEKDKRKMGMSWKLRIALRFFKPPLLGNFATAITSSQKKKEKSND